MTTHTPAELLTILVERMQAYARDDDEELLSARTHTELRELVAAATTPEGGLPFDVALFAGQIHWYRHLANGDEAELHAARTLFGLIARADPDLVPQPFRHLVPADPWALAEEAAALLQPAVAARDADAMEPGIGLLRAAVDATGDDDPVRAVMLSNLGVALRVRGVLRSSDAELTEAAALGREAVARTPAGHPSRADLVAGFDDTLRACRDRSPGGLIDNLDEAIGIRLERLRGSGTTALLSDLAELLRNRFERQGDGADLDLAVEAATSAAQDPADRVLTLGRLAGALTRRYEHRGDLADLNDAIAAGTEAAAAGSDNGPNQAGLLSNLGHALSLRAAHLGTADDLREAIRITREAVAATPDGDPDLGGRRSNLALLLERQAERGDARTHLDEAVEVARRALADTSEADPERASRYANLAMTLIRRFEETDDQRDLDDGIEAARTAATTLRPGDPAATNVMTNLGGALYFRFTRARVTADLDEAIVFARRAVDAAGPSHPHRSGYLSNLSTQLRARFAHAGDETDLDDALTGWRTAARAVAVPVSARILAARQYADTTARYRGPEAALEPYVEAIRMLPLLAWPGLHHADQHHLLTRHAASLGRDGAACAIAAGRPELAVELLEAGRGVFWTQLSGMRGDLSGLRSVDAELADGLDECRRLLDGPDAVQDLPARLRASQRFDALVTKARALAPTDRFPRPSRFLLPPALDTLLPGQDDGPVVSIVISAWRCDALVLTAGGVRVIPLPDLRDHEVIAQANDYLHGLTGGPALEQAVTSTLEWLWDRVVAPILDTVTASRLWWCPTGPLTLLPLHAAGHHGTGESVLDRVVSSYTPTLRALAETRSRTTAAAAPEHLLVIALPDTPGQSPLPGAAAEAGLLAGEATTVLRGPAATRHSVLTELARHRWLHVSCHGTQNLDFPADGGLLPHDWRDAGLVTVADLAGRQWPGGEFAFLSACKTATGGVAALDEVITLSAAMHHAGWRHVVGTQWSVGDGIARIVAKRLYARLRHGGTLHDASGAATALHEVLIRLRKDYPRNPSAWSRFIHTGP
ncbi:CHAT domain-containing protein [Catenuloplanes japonicus]|uniref:CHAT domain-containing protein n=1 Tax=Catenuloplanes japonicus TaxID=33876 RepID=UPI00052512E3|nr:CHAT domain-containing protein [Catenuloplanes japonicus]